MKKARLIFTIILCISLIMPLNGCFSTQNPDDKNITLQIYNQNSSLAGPVNGWISELLKSRFNISLNIMHSVNIGYAAYVEAGNIGDIIIFNNISDYRTAYNAGLLFNWEDYNILSDYGTYMAEHYNDALESNRRLNPDGAIHGIRGNISASSENAESTDMSYVRWDLYKRLGYPKISTVDDFEQLLNDMTELERETNPGSVVYAVSAYPDNDGNTPYIISSTAALFGYVNFGFGFYNSASDSYETCFEDDGIYMKCLRLYNRLYRRGLLDPDSVSLNYDIIKQDYADGRAIFTPFSDLAREFNLAHASDEDVSMEPLVADDFSVLSYPASTIGNGSIFCISANSAYPEYCMKVINWLFTPEGVLELNYGPKDVIWAYDYNGNPYITDYGKECFKKPTLELTGDYSGRYMDGLLDLSCQTLNPYSHFLGENITFDYSTWSEEENADNESDDWNQYTGCDSLDEYIAKKGSVTCKINDFVFDKMDSELLLFSNQIASEICTYSWNAIYASDDAEFDSIIQDMKTLVTGHDAYESINDYYENQLTLYKNF